MSAAALILQCCAFLRCAGEAIKNRSVLKDLGCWRSVSMRARNSNECKDHNHSMLLPAPQPPLPSSRASPCCMILNREEACMSATGLFPARPFWHKTRVLQFFRVVASRERKRTNKGSYAAFKALVPRRKAATRRFCIASLTKPLQSTKLCSSKRRHWRASSTSY